MEQASTGKEKKINQNDAWCSVTISGTRIRVKSVFSGNITLEKALSNLALRRLSESKISRQ
jgi:hypothetical protein